MKGRLIVIDGIDGAGKTTQVDLLARYLTKEKIPFEIIAFPRYEDNLYGNLIKRYLEGEFGKITQVNAYFLALAYAGDRLLSIPVIENWLNLGKLVIANRYVSSSKAHLSANIAEDGKEEFMRWVDNLEYQTNGLPREDLSILLNINAKIGQENTKGKHTDIHEQNLNHLTDASLNFIELSKAEPNWKVVNCMDGDKMKSKEEIHKAIVEAAKAYLVS